MIRTVPGRPVIDAFIEAACVPRSTHASGTLAEAEALLAAHPDLATRSVYVAAVVGDAKRVEVVLAGEPSQATATGGPYGWDALTYVCFSNFLSLRGSDGFVQTARALLDAGADPNSGFFEDAHEPEATFESVLYGAAGVAHHGELTRLLLEGGADPNRGGEVTYQAPEGYDDDAMQAVVQSGRLVQDGLTTMLHRKLDWHHLDGVRWLLGQGADPNALSSWGDRALHHALARENDLPFIEALVEFGADPTLDAPRRD